MQSKTSFKPAWLIAAIVAVGACAGFYGAGKATVLITGCKATVSRYVLAHFSEDYTCIDTGIDANGNPYSEVDTCTHTWTKPASHVQTTVTVNGEGAGPFMKDGYYFGVTPAVETYWQDDPYFDRYSREHNVVITQYHSDGTSRAISKHLKCLTEIGTEVTFRTVYGVKLWRMN